MRRTLGGTVLVIVSVAASLGALLLTFSWAGPVGGYHRYALYRPSTWRDLEFAELTMASRGFAVAVLLVVAAFAATLVIQQRRPSTLPNALPALAGAAMVGSLLLLTGVVRLVERHERILQSEPLVEPTPVPTFPHTVVP